MTQAGTVIRALRPRYHLLRAARLPGSLARRSWVRCPCCGRVDARYAPFAGQQSVVCRYCGAQVRQRALALFVQGERLARGSRVLHLAPDRESFLERWYAGADARVVRLDIEAESAQVLGDLQRLPVKDRSLDVVVCSHVLEHVPDDRRALAEIHRVLRPGGRAYVMVPLDGGRATTYVDPEAHTAEQQRESHWWEGHLRLYGRDFADLPRAAGFEVREVRPAGGMSAAEARRVGVPPQEAVFVCERVDRAG